jgi:NTP-dependent ternary system trypsin peptidase co-occuring protein
MCGAAILLFTLSTSFPVSVTQDPATGDAITIQEVLTEVQRGLSEVQHQLVAAQIPPLDSVVLHLLTEYNVSGGPKFRVLIFSFGKTWERQRSNELTITLKPPKPDQQLQSVTTPGLASQLVAAIVAAAQGVKDAEVGTPPLQLASLKAEFGFVVKESTSAGAKFEIVPVSADLKADWSKKAVHTITVTFASKGKG